MSNIFDIGGLGVDECWFSSSRAFCVQAPLRIVARGRKIHPIGG
jgi:hypothetical protein